MTDFPSPVGSSSPSPGRRGGRGKKKTTTAALVVAVLIGGYSLLRPKINEATGWNLPAVAQSDPKPAERSEPRPAERSVPKPTSRVQPPAEETANPITPAADAVPKPGVDADAGTDGSLKYGLLREIQPDRFLSPAGLLYTPGSAEGHRLKHVARHTEDQPGRAGKHGVFDGGMEKAVAVIDQAFEKAKAGVRTTTTTDQGRTIHTVDMGKRIGFIGGREGNQKRKPMARRVRLVIDGNRIITAYPM